MQNSNGSNSDTYNNHSIIDKDFLQANQMPSKDCSPINKSNFPMTTYDYLNPPSMLLNSGSVAAYPLYGNPQMSILQSHYEQPPSSVHSQGAHIRHVSDVDNNKENLNYNNNMFFQIPRVQPAYQQMTGLQYTKTLKEPLDQ